MTDKPHWAHNDEEDAVAQGSTTRRPTIRMVAERAGVSVATVSYVLSGRPGAQATGVREDTAVRVRSAAEDLGYVPNSSARAVRTGRTGTILLSLTMLSDPWSLSIVRAVSRSAAAAGLTPLIAADTDWLPLVNSVQSDAIFIDSATPKDQDLFSSLAARGHNLVVLHSDLKPDGFDVVRSEEPAGCRLLADRLIDQFETVGLLTPKGLEPASVSHRAMAYVEALEARGMDVRPQWCPPAGDDETSAFRAALTVLRSPDRPRALMATSEYIAQAALGAAAVLGLRPGTDIGIAGVGNAFDDRSGGVGLTSVGPEGFFDAVADLLVGRATGADTSPRRAHAFAWQVFDRETTLGI
ncbi:LacI family DNA-binding transcriptional regulator [Knoellia sp. CPCC 206453]|uniref:LacI family DNA-binding transcriptional regulator n=1 Tax=Knoellia pratensis TaxID=3404796 RepID=UPI00360EADDC